jgi:thymidine phosphorylase
VAALELGAGRRTKSDSVDHAVGIVCCAKRGDAVARGAALAHVHARTVADASTAATAVRAAYEIADAPPPATPVLLDVLE